MPYITQGRYYSSSGKYINENTLTNTDEAVLSNL